MLHDVGMFCHEIKPIGNAFKITNGLIAFSDNKLGYAIILGSRNQETGAGYYEKIAVDNRKPPLMKPMKGMNKDAHIIETASFRSYQLNSGVLKSCISMPSLEELGEENNQVLVRINTHKRDTVGTKLAREGKVLIVTPSLAIKVVKGAFHQYSDDPRFKAEETLLKMKQGASIIIQSDHIDVPTITVIYNGTDFHMLSHENAALFTTSTT